MCEAMDCVGGTDEVNCGLGKTFTAIIITERMLVMYHNLENEPTPFFEGCS